MLIVAVSVITVVLVATLAAPSSASTPPAIVHHQAFDESTPTLYVSCGSTDIVATASGVVTTKQFFDGSGQLIAEDEAYTFTGTLQRR